MTGQSQLGAGTVAEAKQDAFWVLVQVTVTGDVAFGISVIEFAKTEPAVADKVPPVLLTKILYLRRSAVHRTESI